MAQLVEVSLSTLFLLERDKRSLHQKDMNAFIQSFGEVRSDCYISTLEGKLRVLGVPSAVLIDVGQVAKRRNHLAHRIVHDSGFLKALGSPSEPYTFADDLRLFTTCQKRIEEQIFLRAAELNVRISRAPTSSVDQICGFAERVLDRIQRKRKEK